MEPAATATATVGGRLDMVDEPIPSDQVCDACRQHRAVIRFVDTDMGVARCRRMCATCFSGYHSTTGAELIDIDKLVLLQGKCERCGKPAVCASGIPGPDRLVLCEECADKVWGDEGQP